MHRSRLKQQNTDVYDHKHVHQLLQLTQHEELSSIQCQPCGPVIYSSVETYDEEQETMAYHQQKETDEIHYTKVIANILL